MDRSATLTDMREFGERSNIKLVWEKNSEELINAYFLINCNKKREKLSKIEKLAGKIRMGKK